MTSYRDLYAVNISSLKHMSVSPLRYHHTLTHPRKDTDAMRCGRMSHVAVLQPDVLDLWPVWDGGDRTGATWKKFHTEAGEDYVWKPGELDAARGLATVVHANPVARVLLQHADAIEKPIVRTDPRTGLLLKARLDLRNGIVVDLKTTKMALSQRMIERQIVSLHYHTAAAFYLDMAGLDTFKWIFVEQAAPHDVAVVPATEMMIIQGRKLYEGWLDQLVECRRTDKWPGIAGGREMQVGLPAYALTDDYQMEDTE